MKKLLVFLVAVAVLTVVSTSQGAIRTVSATAVNTWFVSNTGVLSMGENTSIDVEFTGGTITTYEEGWFNFTTTLLSDTSAGGIASGSFTGGDFTYKNSAGAVLLSGNLSSFAMAEVFNGSGILAGEGQFTVTGGSLQPTFGPSGDIVDISFRVNPKGISDFDTDFTGWSDVTVMPVPEPATMCLMGIGALGLLRKRNKA